METKTTITCHGLEDIDFERSDDELGSMTLTITTLDGTKIEIDCGRFHDDAEEVRKVCQWVVNHIDNSILKNWEDRPDDDDGYVGFDNGRYHVSLGTQHVGTYPNQDIAEYHLAEAMSQQGYFPNCWYVNDRGNIDDIGDSVRKYHDAGGTNMLSLEGVEYEHGQSVLARIYISREEEWCGAYIIRDYGNMGITYEYRGDGDIHFTDDRDDIKVDPNAEDDE